MDFWQKLILFIVGSGFGFIIGEIVFYRPLYEDYKKMYNEYYGKWFKLHRHACEAWWCLKRGHSTQAFNELDMYYGDEDDKS